MCTFSSVVAEAVSQVILQQQQQSVSDQSPAPATMATVVDGMVLVGVTVVKGD